MRLLAVWRVRVQGAGGAGRTVIVGDLCTNLVGRRMFIYTTGVEIVAAWTNGNELMCAYVDDNGQTSRTTFDALRGPAPEEEND